MSKCIKCGTETKLYDRGVAICPNCADLLEAKANRPVVEESPRDGITGRPASKIARSRGVPKLDGHESN